MVRENKNSGEGEGEDFPGRGDDQIFDWWGGFSPSLSREKPVLIAFAPESF